MTQPAPTPNERPVNPFFTRDYSWYLPIAKKQMVVTIPAPGGSISEADAADAIELLQLIIKRLQRDIARAVGLEGEVGE